MFIVGLVVGPAVGILAGDYLVRSMRLQARWIVLALFAVLLIVTLMPFFAPELKFGLMIGLSLGVLLSVTPAPVPSQGGQPEPR